MFIFKVCNALKESRVIYAIVGGYAVSLHGAVRGTVDIDIVIAWSLENLQKAEGALKKMGLISQLPLNAITVFNNKEDYVLNRNLIAWNFFNPKILTEQVDLIITYDLNPSTVTTVKTNLGEINILSRKQLIEMKTLSGRPQDLQDVKALENL